MAKKKVIDADLLNSKLLELETRYWHISNNQSPMHYGSDPNLNQAISMVSNSIQQQVGRTIDQTIKMLVVELRIAMQNATRDEHDGMCGLCRVDPNGGCEPPKF